MKIEAKELRIGNMLDYFGDEVIINSIRKDNTYYLGGKHKHTHIYSSIEAFKPIPLTHECADKLGYENLVEMACVFNNDSFIHIEISSSDLAEMTVSEAQNFYHSITRGKELEISPSKG